MSQSATEGPAITLAGEVTPLHHNPLVEFQKWYDKACNSSEVKPDACVLATSSLDGWPSARVILFKGFLQESVLFYTNYQGQKGRELILNPKAALVFYWPHLGKQVRFTGSIEKLSYELSQRYFQTRPRGSQLGALTSPQSQVLQSRQELEEKIDHFKAIYQDKVIPCPSHWGGFRLIPKVIEFWIDGHDRLHDRFQFQKDGEASVWICQRLSP